MKNKNAKIAYDPEADVLSVENNTTTPIAYAQEMGNLVVHFSKKDEPILVEILQASALFKKQSLSLKNTIRRALVVA
jgi:uncharacterized protein YuzE